MNNTFELWIIFLKINIESRQIIIRIREYFHIGHFETFISLIDIHECGY
jgi:hypothetical protein